MELVDFIPLATALALPVKLMDWLKYLKDKDANGAITQALVWFGGIGTMFLLAATDFAGGIDIGGVNLSAMNGATLVFLGLSLGSTGSFAFDFKKSFDNTDSAAAKPLINNSNH